MTCLGNDFTAPVAYARASRRQRGALETSEAHAEDQPCAGFGDCHERAGAPGRLRAAGCRQSGWRFRRAADRAGGSPAAGCAAAAAPCAQACAARGRKRGHGQQLRGIERARPVGGAHAVRRAATENGAAARGGMALCQSELRSRSLFLSRPAHRRNARLALRGQNA